MKWSFVKRRMFASNKRRLIIIEYKTHRPPFPAINFQSRNKNFFMASQFIETALAADKVVVFSKSYCPYCKKAKDALKRANIAFKAYEIENRAGTCFTKFYLIKIRLRCDSSRTKEDDKSFFCPACFHQREILRRRRWNSCWSKLWKNTKTSVINSNLNKKSFRWWKWWKSTIYN